MAEMQATVEGAFEPFTAETCRCTYEHRADSSRPVLAEAHLEANPRRSASRRSRALVISRTPGGPIRAARSSIRWGDSNGRPRCSRPMHFRRPGRPESRWIAPGGLVERGDRRGPLRPVDIAEHLCPGSGPAKPSAGWRRGDRHQSGPRGQRRAWRRLEGDGIVVREWAIDPDTAELRVGDLEALLGVRTRVVAFTHGSNVVGSINPVREITDLVHRAGAIDTADGLVRISFVHYTAREEMDRLIGVLGTLLSESD